MSLHRSLVASIVAAVLLLGGTTSAAAASGYQIDDDGSELTVDFQPTDPMPYDPIPPDPAGDVEPAPIAPLPWVSVQLRGDVWANGAPIGEVDFAIIWNDDDRSHVQLWSLLEDVPSQVCVGRVFDTPGGEPIFFGTTSLMEPSGICHMSRLADRSGIALFAASNDGQWASAILRNPNQQQPLAIFD